MATKAHVSGLLLLLSALLAGGLRAQSDFPPPFPRQNATKLLDTDRFVVWNVVWPNGQPTALHRHVYDQVGTYYARGSRTITTPDGEARRTTTEVGSLSTTRKGTTHVEEGTSDPPLKAVFIELKRDTGTGQPLPLLTATDNVTVVGARQTLDDDRVRVTDATPAIGAERAYRAAADTVIVYLSAGRVKLTGADARTRELKIEPGTMRYVARGARERETIVDGPPRSMTFELK